MKIDKFYLFLFSILVFFTTVFWPTPKSLLLVDQNLSAPTTSLSDSSAEIIERAQHIHYRQNIPILMYHYIRQPSSQESSTGKILSVSPKTFEKQLKIIESYGLKTVTLGDWADNKISQPSVILTFDDGYSDFYTNAWPILIRYGAQATVFVITNKINQPGYLTSNQIQELSGQNIEIGSHTVSHPNLTNTGDANIKKQLEDSKYEIEGIIAKRVISFSYPSGQYNEKIMQEVKNSGYASAVTTDSDIASLNRYTLFSLPRLRMKETTDLLQIFKDYNL